MNREEITHYSQCLDREMHIMVYGRGGIPFLSFPTQDSMCHNYEDFPGRAAGAVFPLHHR